MLEKKMQLHVFCERSYFYIPAHSLKVLVKRQIYAGKYILCIKQLQAIVFKFLLTIQVAALKDTIAKKDEEIERLQLLKDFKNVYPSVNGEKHGTAFLRYGSSSPSKESIGGIPQQSQKPSGGKGLGLPENAAFDHENCSEHSDKHSEANSQQSMDDFKYQKEFLQQSEVAREDISQNIPAEVEILGYGDTEYEERLSVISDGGLSVGTETDGSVENSIFSEGSKQLDNLER
jgi:kinesin family protein C2/C3